VLLEDLTEGNEFAQAGVGEDNVDSLFHLADGLVETIQVGQLCDVSLIARHNAAELRRIGRADSREAAS
jgi:hypothetical protein